LYGYETWSLTLREEHRIQMFDNRVLRRISGPKTKETTRSQRKLHNDELPNLYSSPNIIRMMKSKRMRYSKHVASTRHKQSAQKVLKGKPEGKRQLGRTRNRWKHNTIMCMSVCL
jgi:hypothetical protein